MTTLPERSEEGATRLPFLSTKTQEQLAATTPKERKKPGKPSKYTPHELRLSNMYRWHCNWFRRKGQEGYEGLKVEMTKEEWMMMWQELIPKLPIDFPLHGLKHLNNPYVEHIPAWMLRSNKALRRSQETIEALRATGGAPNGRNAAIEAYRRSQGKAEARARWKEEQVLTPAFKLQLRKIDIHKPFRLDNVKLVCVEIGDKRIEMGEERRIIELWRL